jgi:hypothetical protein
MKILAFIFSAFLLFFSFSSNAQKGSEPGNNYRPVSAPLKGYYSIGNNATKLKGSSNEQVFSGFRASKKKKAPVVQKGYYATGNHQSKLGEQITFEDVRPSGQSYNGSRPTKGYYSIGRNAEKLQK